MKFCHNVKHKSHYFDMLTGDNYSLWKFKIKQLLMKNCMTLYLNLETKMKFGLKVTEMQ